MYVNVCQWLNGKFITRKMWWDPVKVLCECSEQQTQRQQYINQRHHYSVSNFPQTRLATTRACARTCRRTWKWHTQPAARTTFRIHICSDDDEYTTTCRLVALVNWFRCVSAGNSCKGKPLTFSIDCCGWYGVVSRLQSSAAVKTIILWRSNIFLIALFLFPRTSVYIAYTLGLKICSKRCESVQPEVRVRFSCAVRSQQNIRLLMLDKAHEFYKSSGSNAISSVELNIQTNARTKSCGSKWL